MNRTEYIGKLNALYVGDKNCLEELITTYDEKDKEIERLKNIIEEDKKISKLDFVEENTFSKRQNGMTSEDRRLLDSNFRELGTKINEIIDKLNEGKE